MERKYKVLIVDNNRAVLDDVEIFLREFPQFQIANPLKNGQSAKVLILKEKPDVLFLDVELRGVSGLDLIRSIRESIDWNLHIIFCGPSNIALLEMMRESAFDFLLKPLSVNDFRLVMNRLLKVLYTEEQTIKGLQYNVKNKSLHSFSDDAVLITTYTNEVRVLRIDNIGYFRHNHDKRNWEIVLTDSTVMSLRHIIKAEDILKKSSVFFQTHQSYIVNLEFLELVKISSCQLLPPFEKVTEVKISANYRKQLCEIYSCF